MTPDQFVYWLQGYFELTDASPRVGKGLTVEQVDCIKDHLDLVLTKVTPKTTHFQPNLSQVPTQDPILWYNSQASC